MRWTAVQVSEALGVPLAQRIEPSAIIGGVSIDSRTVGAGELFVAIRGPRHDGHAFVASALERGA
ncbi:MAG TPA: Mur ligase domain-containing protein, partial [Verrucomicrobiae bacterium]|nr:Mur ligase domain-containing protein [Verrucomicrobiae bacterium]